MISYKFKLYNTKQTKHLELMLQEARFVWNRMLGLQKRYYNIFNKYASAVQLQKHYAIIGMAAVFDGYPLYFDAVNEKGLSY